MKFKTVEKEIKYGSIQDIMNSNLNINDMCLFIISEKKTTNGVKRVGNVILDTNAKGFSSLERIYLVTNNFDNKFFQRDKAIIIYQNVILLKEVVFKSMLLNEIVNWEIEL